MILTFLAFLLPNADPYIIRAILWTLSETQASFAIKWLSGDELANSNAEALGLPNPTKTNQDREAEALKNVQQIVNLVSYYNPIVICFDEIDVENNCSSEGLTTPQVIADLVKRLHDTLEQSEIGRGVVILTVMLPDTWTDKVNLMPGGTPDRVSKYTQRKPIDLKTLNADSMVELATVWLKDFYEFRNLKPHHLLYPFEESELRKYGKNGLTVREALKWFTENFKVVGKNSLPEDPLQRFYLALEKENQSKSLNFLEDNHLKIDDITEFSEKPPNNGYINFKIIAYEKDNLIKIGVAVLQPPKKSILSGLNRLIDYNKFDITRGCIVRSYDKKIDKRGEAYKLLEHLKYNLGGEWVDLKSEEVTELSGEWVDLKSEEVTELIYFYSVYQRCENYQLTKEQVIDFSRMFTRKNPLLLEILSSPSSHINEETIEAEELLNSFLNPSSVETTDDSEDLSELLS